MLGGTQEAPSDADTVIGTSQSPRRGTARRVERGDGIGRYVVLGRLGSGSMGVVYSAYDPELDRRVAIKLLRFESDEDDDLSRAGLLREAQAMARITHPNVVTVHDVGTDGRRVYVAMEFIDGQTLRVWLARQARPWREILDVFVHAARGLQAAHHQGLVHRDFKPDNVMVAADARVVVMDFGLAQGERKHDVAPDALLSSSRSMVTARVTDTAGVAGTPAYMSPEQLGGTAADARSDQFSFCVALFEAMYGVPPFRPQPLPALAYAIATGKIREVPAGSAVPQFVRRVVLRGLSAEPNDRWPSIGALLDALDDRTRRHRRTRLTALAATAGACAIAGATWWSIRPPEPCSGAATRLSGVWDDSERAKIESVVAALDAPWAATTLAAVTQHLDEYARAWIDAHTEACRATTVYGAQSAALMDLRIACLERARMDLQATSQQLANADPDVLARAHSLAAALPDLLACGDVERLNDEALPALDPEDAAELDAVQRALATARAESVAGRYASAESSLLALRGRVEAIGQLPLHGEHRLLLARALVQLGRPTEARVDGEEALRSALAAARPELARRVAQELVNIVANDERKPAEGLIYANIALGLAQRDGQPHALSGAHAALGRAHGVAGSTTAAEQHLRRALELDPADDPVRTAWLQVSLAEEVLNSGRSQLSLAVLREAGATMEAVLGPEHPDLVVFHQSLGNTLFRLALHAEADAEYRRGLAIATAAFGEDHPSSIGARLGLATQLAVADRHAEAEIEFRALLLSVERTMGSTSPRAALVRSNLAAVLNSADRDQEAEAQSRHALAIYATTLGEDHVEAAAVTSTLGRSLAAQGRHEEAVTVFRRSVAMRERELGPNHRQVGRELLRHARSLAAMGRSSEAGALLERAVQILEQHRETTASELATARFELALTVASVDPTRARSLVEAALDDLPPEAKIRALAWLGERGG